MHFLTRALVTTVSFTEQYWTRVKGLTDKKDKSFPGAKGERKEEGGFSSFSVPNTLGLSLPHFRGRLTKGRWAVCATARRGLGCPLRVKMPGQAIHALPTQVPCGMVRKYKSGSNAGHHVQTAEGTELLQSLSQPQPC